MTDEFTFEQSPWERMLDTVPENGTVSASGLLTQIESEEQWQAAFEALNAKHITLDVSRLPVPQVGGETGLRLQREQALAEAGELMTKLAPEDTLRIYLKELQDCTGETEAELMLPQVVKAAEANAGRGVLLLDLIQEGSLGLWQGLENGSKDLQWWIDQYMAGALTVAAFAGGIGEKMRRQVQAYDSADRQLLAELGRNPTAEEIAVHLGITPEEGEILQDALETARKRAPKTEDTSEEQAQSPENTAAYRQSQRVQELLGTLTEQEAKLVSLRFGLDGKLPVSPEEAGRILGMTPEQVLEAEAATLKKMRG